MTRLMAPIRWYGGKGNMVAKVVATLPRGKVYVEPYFGAGSIFWNVQPYPCEVVNDLSGDLINLMRVIQDAARCDKLQRRLAGTLYSLDEFRLALRTLADNHASADDRAWAFYVAKNQGFGGVSKTEGQWGRDFTSSRGTAATVSKWWSRFELFPQWHQRIARAQIDNRDALEVIRYWDSQNTVFYLDPPYVADTRKSKDVYTHECSDAHHRKLVDLLLGLQGQAVLSGYETSLYAPLIDAGWTRVVYDTVCHAAGRTRNSGLHGKGSAMAKVPRTEVLWCSPKHKRGLFS